MCELAGQTALVTGGAQGIGLGISLELARAGSNVIIASRSLEKAMTAAEQVRAATGREVIPLPLDVTAPEVVRDCVRAAIDYFSRIDIVVNNAGVHSERVGQVSNLNQFRSCFDVNLFGVWCMTQELAPHFKTHRAGKIINIASINGRQTWAETPAYSASKAALISLTQSLAVKLGEYNINVNAVCPGGVITPMAKALVGNPAELEKQIIRERLLKRSLLPEDIGHAVVFLASSRSRNITGQALNVDGGAVMN
jgi:NAD(P)-dependent dehydrogenase (short-subunit alcohol dehydrogenase family)